MFTLNKPFLPLNTGRQFRLLGAGGPSGNVNGTMQATPWPYMTGTRAFITPGPYGIASSAFAQMPVPYITGAAGMFLPGYIKQPTFTNVVF